MKGSKHRDELAVTLKDKTGGDFICFEMEVAGLMNDFPCLVRQMAKVCCFDRGCLCEGTAWSCTGQAVGKHEKGH